MEKVSKPFPHVPQHAPWLAFFSHGKRNKAQSFYTIVEGRSYVRNIPQMSRKTCLGYSKGLLVMLEPKTKGCSLLNPTTMDSVILPSLVFSYGNCKCILSSAPTDPKCALLFVDCFKPEIMFCYLGENSWRKITYELDEGLGLFHCVSCNGKLYGLTFEEKLVIIDFDTDPRVVRIGGISVPQPRLVTSMSVRYLVESCGEIFMVHIEIMRHTDAVISFNIFKMDFLNEKWLEVRSIGDRAFFLCNTHTLSCSACERGIVGDSIYYVQDGDPSLYRFDMIDRGINVDLPCPNLTTPWYAPHWIFLDELCLSRPQLPSISSQKSLMEPRFSENINTMGVNNESKTGDGASEVDPLSDLVPEAFQSIVRHDTLEDRYNGLAYGFPCLASISRDGKACTLVDTEGNEMRIKCQNLPSPCIILYSKGGWLLVLHPLHSDEQELVHSIFFFNPMTKTRIDLPNIKFPYRIRAFSFSSPPTSPDCIVIAFRSCGCNVFICRRGDKEWTDLGEDDSDSFIMSHVSPIFCKGSFYCLSDNGRLGVFDPSSNIWSIKQYGKSVPHFSGANQLYVVESDGELIVVFCDKCGDVVQLHQLDPLTNQWKEIDNIGRRTLFVGRMSSICSKADVLSGNRIFFPRIKDGVFLSYSCDELKFHPARNFYESKVFQLSFWIDPVFDTSSEEQLKWIE